jgi:hypothetical protein
MEGVVGGKRGEAIGKKVAITPFNCPVTGVKIGGSWSYFFKIDSGREVGIQQLAEMFQIGSLPVEGEIESHNLI